MKTLLLGMILLATTTQASLTNHLLAHFHLNENSHDSQNLNPPADLRNAPFLDGSLFLNGRYENSGGADGFRTTFSITNLDYHSLTVALDFFPLSFTPSRKFNAAEKTLNFLTRGYYWRWFGSKRSDNETILVGGNSYRWLGFRYVTNTLQLTLNNQALVHPFTNVTLSLKQWHNLACSVDLKQRRILVMLDGRQLEAISLPPDFKLNIIGEEAESSDREFTFANYSYGSAFYGYAANLKAFDRALISTELIDLYSESSLERAGLPPRNASSGMSGKLILATVAVLLGLIGGYFIQKRHAKNNAGRSPR